MSEDLPWTLPIEIQHASGELETIPSPHLSDDCAHKLDKGITKRLRILHMPFGGNSLFFYDENLRLIQDAHALYHAKAIIFTNQARQTGSPLRGRFLFDQEAIMHGSPFLHTFLRLEHDGGTHVFRDEYSFWLFETRHSEFLKAEGYLC